MITTSKENFKGAPLLDLKAHDEPLQKEIMVGLEQTFKSQALIPGSEVSKFEERIGAYFQTKRGIGVSSRNDAFVLPLRAMGVSSGDEVITIPYSFFATTGAVARLGAKPVLVDIDIERFNIDPSKISKANNAKTKAIIPVHLYGQSPHYEFCPPAQSEGHRGCRTSNRIGITR